ncbi:MAG: hypothetical protein JW808_02805 [Victivallales bacterium]|nr:hypothetical protein [Victivallales bacterium]
MEQWMTSLGSAWKACWINLLFMISAYSLGRVCLEHLCGRRRGDVLLSMITGINIAALLSLSFAVTGVFRTMKPAYIIYLSLFPSALYIFRLVKNSSKNSLPKFRGEIIALLLLTLFFAGASLSMPIGWDEMVYHHSVVQRWITDGSPLFYPDIPYSAFPSANSFIYWMLTDSGTVIAPRLFLWVCWVISLLALMKISNIYGLSRGKSLLLAMAFATSQIMLLVVSDAYVEVILLMNTAGMLLSMAGASCARTSTEDDPIGTSVLFGIMAGGAGAIKLTGLILFAIPAAWFVNLLHLKKHDRAGLLRSAAIFTTVGMLVAAPFYIRPLTYTGNPLYPYFCEWFTDSPPRIAMSEFHHKIGSEKFGSRSLAIFFAAPLALSSNDNSFDGNFGWQFFLVLAIATAGIVFAKASASKLRVNRVGSAGKADDADMAGSETGPKERMMYMTAALALLFYIFWFFSAQQARFLIPAALTIYTGAGICITKMRKSLQTCMIGLLLMLTILSLPWKASGYYYYSWSQLLGMTRRIDFVNTGTGGDFLSSVDAVMHLTPENSKLMLIFEHRILYYPRRTVIGTPYFQEQFFTPSERFTKIDDIYAELEKSGADYLMVAMRPEGPDELPEYIEKHAEFAENLSQLIPTGQLVEIWRSKNHSLFKIRQSSQIKPK